MSTFIITTRNPGTRKLVIIKNGSPEGDERFDEDDPAEFETEDEAHAVAGEHTLLQAWGYDVIEVP